MIQSKPHFSTIKKVIFGKRYEFIVDQKYEGLVGQSVDLYGDYEGESCDIQIRVPHGLEESETLLSRNPAIFSRYKHSMVTDFGNASIRWKPSTESKPFEIYISPRKRSFLYRGLVRILSMEFANEIELFEQLLHEFVLIPSIYFGEGYIPIHGAAIAHHNRGILITGTGGAGKTSALLSLQNESNVSFLSDDISVISADSYIHPNMAWPKIYGYNILGTDLRPHLLANRGIVDKLHFYVRLKINPARVRRKIRPEKLFGEIGKDPRKLNCVFFLVRENVPSFEIEELQASEAAQMCLAVLQTEYSVFHRHLHWERFNAIAIQEWPLLNIEDVFANWKSQMEAVFSGIPVMKIAVPITMPHFVYLNQIKETILKGTLSNAISNL